MSEYAGKLINELRVPDNMLFSYFLTIKLHLKACYFGLIELHFLSLSDLFECDIAPLARSVTY